VVPVESNVVLDKPVVVVSAPISLLTTTTALDVERNVVLDRPVATVNVSIFRLIPTTVVNVPTNAAPMLVVAESV
jgi:hypothetical protein